MIMTSERAKEVAKLAAHFQQALLVEGVDISSANSITGNFVLYCMSTNAAQPPSAKQQ